MPSLWLRATMYTTRLIRAEGALLAVASSVVVPRLALAAPDGAGELEAPAYEVVVTGEREPRDDVNERLIERERLRESGARTAAEALEQLPAAHFRANERGERVLTLRGFEQRQTAILIDGAPLATPFDGLVDLNMIPVELIECITVSQSPSAFDIGAQSLGGVVNIVTREPGDGPLAAASFEARYPYSVGFNGIHSARSQELGYTLYGGMLDDGGFRPASGSIAGGAENERVRLASDRQDAFVGGSVAWHPNDRHELSAKAVWLDAQKGVPPSVELTSPRFWRFSSWRAAMLSAEHSYTSSINVSTLVYANLFDNLLESFDDASFTTQLTPASFSSWFHERSLGIRAEARILPGILIDDIELRLSTTAQYDHHDQDKTTEPDVASVLVNAAPEIVFTPLEHLVAGAGVGLGSELPIDLPGESSEPAIGLSPFLRIDWREKEWQLGLSASGRHRFPTLKERFTRARGFRLANPELGPEQAWHLEMHVSTRVARRIETSLALFDAEIVDLIERVPLGGGIDQIQNVGRARILGAEARIRLALLPSVDVDAGYRYLHTRKLDRNGGEPLEYRPSHRATVLARFEPYAWASLALQVQLVGTQRFRHPETLQDGELGTYAVTDLRIELLPLDGVACWMRATNLLDVSYQTQIGFPSPGRQLWAGLRVAL